MTKSSILFLFVAFTHLFIAATAEEQIDTRPRGVPPQLVSFYQESTEFECLDGSKKIPFDQVNDDYCDCGDGSDEPGTAACKNGKFYCSNFGHQSVLIPSNRVNDYICDCCDGSDEWDSGTECPNICEAQGSKAREEAKKQKAIEEIGWGKRVELAKEGQKMLEERKVELEKKKKELEELEAQKGGIEERKKEAENAEEIAKKRQDDLWEEEKKRKERKEAEEFLGKMDTDGDGKIKKEELRKYIGQNDDGGGQNDEEEGGGGKEEEMLKEIFGEEADTLDLEMIIAKLYTIRDLINIKAAKEDGPKEEEGGEGESEEKATEITEPQYDEETRKLIEKADEIRKEFDELGGKIGKMQDEIRECEQFLEFEYGKDQEWAPMKDKCAELMTTQYVYKICLFDKTVQKDRSGYSEINLGYWGAWNGPDEANKFSVQKYDHGQSCWNGPERSTIVELECGIELELIEASEPSKCEYKFVVKAPAACKNPEENKNEHSEL